MEKGCQISRVNRHAPHFLPMRVQGPEVQEGPGDPFKEFIRLKSESATSPFTQRWWRYLYPLFTFVNESLPQSTSNWLVIK